MTHDSAGGSGPAGARPPLGERPVRYDSILRFPGEAHRMAINIAHRRDLDDRVERLAGRLSLRGRGRKVAVIERALETQVARSRPDRAAILASPERYAEAGTRLRERQIAPQAADRRPPSLRLQDVLYDEHGLPR